MKNPFKSDAIAKLKGTIAKTESAIDKTIARRDNCERLLKEQKEKRKAAMREDPENIPAELRQSINAAERDLATADEEIDELRDSLAELQATLVAAEEKSAGEKSAAMLEAIAGKVDAAAADLETAMMDVAKAAKALENALPATLAVYDQGGWQRPRERKEDGPATPREVVSATLAEALIAVVPGAFDQDWNTTGYQQVLHRYFHLGEPRPGHRTDETPGDGFTARAAAKTLISDRLRTRAMAIRRGEAPSTIDDRTPWTPATVEVASDVASDITVFVVTSFSYVKNDVGHIEMARMNTTKEVPKPVAEIAISKGYALSMETAEGQEAFAAQKESWKHALDNPGAFPLRAEDCAPLGDVMNLMARAPALAD